MQKFLPIQALTALLLGLWMAPVLLPPSCLSPLLPGSPGLFLLLCLTCLTPSWKTPKHGNMAAWLESRGTTFSSVPLPAPGLPKTTEGSEGTLFGIENQKASYL